MGKLERESPTFLGPDTRLPTTNRTLTCAVAGHLLVYAMRSLASQAGHAHLQSQVAEHGQVGQRPS